MKRHATAIIIMFLGLGVLALNPLPGLAGDGLLPDITNYLYGLFGGNAKPSPKVTVGCQSIGEGVAAYRRKLEQERSSAIKRAKEWTNSKAFPVRLAGEKELRKIEERIDNLADDCERIAQIGQSGALSDKTWSDMACNDIASFCDEVHDAAQSFIRGMENNLNTYWDNFQTHATSDMKTMYQSRDDAEPVVTLP